jgi:M6 family metalloprotease-like protein
MCIICVSTISIAALIAPSHAPDQAPAQSLTQTSIQTNATAKAGSTCSKAGITSVASGKTFTCIKSGKKLIWNKGVRTAATMPDPVISLASDFSSSSECKLRKPSNLSMDDGPMGSVGFPKTADALPSAGKVKGLVLFADFPDVVATSGIKSPWISSSIPNAEKLFAFSSYGKMKLKIDLSDKVYRINNQSTYYNLRAEPSGGPIANGPPPKLEEVITEALIAADSDIDFSQYAFVTVATPQSPTLSLSGVTGMRPGPRQFDGVTYTKASFMPLDALTPLDKAFRTLNFTHDIGHMLGLMHPYITTGQGQPVIGAWDIMWNFALQNDFFGWNKWKLDWITDEQISCLSSSPTKILTQLLSPIGSPTKSQKMVVIKLSDASALVIEVRRKTPFENLKSSDEGVIVYKVDSTKVDGSGPFTIVSNRKKEITYQNFRQILGTMKPGESVLNSGYEISVLKSVTTGDYISIKKSA